MDKIEALMMELYGGPNGWGVIAALMEGVRGGPNRVGKTDPLIVGVKSINGAILLNSQT